MAATPQYGTMTFAGRATGKNYSKDIYVSDVANAAIRFDQGGGAGAATRESWIPPEPVVLVDYAQVTGTADTEKLQCTIAGIPTGDILRYGAHLTTLNNRPIPNISVPAGVEFSALQVSD